MDNQHESFNLKGLATIKQYKGYFVSKDGKIISTKRYSGGVLLRQSVHYGRSKSPYLRSKINGRFWLVHRFVMTVFSGRELAADEQINHIDGNTTNNHINNLEIVSHRENVSHAVQANLYCSGKAWRMARGMQECKESSTTRLRSPERTVKAHERGAGSLLTA